MKIKYLILILVATVSNVYGQVGIGISQPDPSSYLDIDVSGLPGSSKKGFLPPRVTEAERNSISNPAPGLLLYNLTEHCINIYNGTDWISLCCTPMPGTGGSSFVSGDIKYAYDITDHSGWYLLDGRSVSSLSSGAASAALALGFTSAIPNFTGRYAKSVNSGASLGINGGASSIAIQKENLPNFTMNGVTGIAGGHSHTATNRWNTAAGGGGRYGAAGTAGWQERGFTDRTTSNTGDHTHTVSYNSGGSNAPVTIQPAYVALNTFIYLGN